MLRTSTCLLRLSATLSLAALLAAWAACQAVAAAERAPTEGSSGGSAKAAVSPGAAALEKAAKNNKYLFIFFFDRQDPHTTAMNGVFQTAMAKMADRAEATAIYVADPAEKPIVDKFGVRGAPMPLVLAIAPTGAATRAFPKQFEEAQFQQAFVSPCTARCMKVIQDRHLILICVQNGKTRFNQEALEGVKSFQADPQYAQATEIVMLNPSDKAEQRFLSALQVDPRTPTAVTLLVTPPGAPVARFVGAVSKEEIVDGLKAAQSSCCPGGKCGPGGCCPK
jgi:hypothetical protein